MPDNREGWDSAREHYLQDRRETSTYDLRVLIFVGVLVVVGIVGLAILWWLVSSKRLDNLKPPVRTYSKQVIGRPLAWRTLVDLGKQRMALSEIAAGNFDRDAEPEFVIRNVLGECFLVEFDGTQTALAGLQPEYTRFMMAWDWDVDGTDEIIVEDYINGTGLVVYNLEGKQLAQFPTMQTMGFSITGDYDGDGFDDLLLLDRNGTSTSVYTSFGNVLRTVQESGAGSAQLLADVDSDGKAELLVFDNQQYSIYGSKQEVESPAWPVPLYGEYTMMAADLTGDGVPELIDPLDCIIDTTAQRMDLYFGQHPNGQALNSSGWLACTVFTDPATGATRLVVIPDSIGGSSVYMMDGTGRTTFQLDLIPQAMDCYTVENQGTEYLVVATSNKVMIYP